MTHRVCCVCAGNICRSPMAESVFHARGVKAGLGGRTEADSAGTGGRHEGKGAGPRAVTVLKEDGYGIEHTARRFRAARFTRLDPVVSLDGGRLAALRRPAPTEQNATAVRLLRSDGPAADGGDLDAPARCYGGLDDAEACLKMVKAAGTGLLAAMPDHMEGRAA